MGPHRPGHRFHVAGWTAGSCEVRRTRSRSREPGQQVPRTQDSGVHEVRASQLPARDGQRGGNPRRCRASSWASATASPAPSASPARTRSGSAASRRASPPVVAMVRARSVSGPDRRQHDARGATDQVVLRHLGRLHRPGPGCSSRPGSSAPDNRSSATVSRPASSRRERQLRRRQAR